MSSSEQPPISPSSGIQKTDEARKKRLGQLGKIADEIVSTEESYAKSLSGLKNDFIEKLKESPFKKDKGL